MKLKLILKTTARKGQQIDKMTSYTDGQNGAQRQLLKVILKR